MQIYFHITLTRLKCRDFELIVFEKSRYLNPYLKSKWDKLICISELREI